MHARNAIAAAAAAVFIAGCSVFPHSPAEVREMQPAATRVCTQLQPSVAASAVSDGWRRCHFREARGSSSQVVMSGKVPILIPTGPTEGDYIRTEGVGSRLTVVKGATVPGSGTVVQMIADIEATQSCPAEVTARGFNAIWNQNAKGVAHYLSANSEGCEPR